MTDLAARPAGGDSVSIVEVLGEWHVHVVDSGRSTVVIFDMRAFAHAYADGQLRRLGLKTDEPQPNPASRKEKGQHISAPA